MVDNVFIGFEKEAVLFNVSSGFFRITFFILYLFIISRLNDVKRLFQYHGAEHRVVYNFESGKKISVDNAQNFPTQHPRCGTSFMFIVLLSAIIVFSIIDNLIMIFTGHINLISRLLFHLPMIPFVAGISYELIKVSSRNENIIFEFLEHRDFGCKISPQVILTMKWLRLQLLRWKRLLVKS